MTENFNLRAGLADGVFSLDTLNSLTKYPSIKTYHPLDGKGVPREVDGSTIESAGISSELPPVAAFTGITDITEKIDGTNARVIILPDGTVILGSREELLYARGDLVKNPQLSIVPTLLDTNVADRAAALANTFILVVYGEVYGAGIGPGKRYSGGQKRTGFRIFDVAYVPTENLVWTSEQASSWRQHGGQKWYSEMGVQSIADTLQTQRVPVLGSVDAQRLPKTIAEAAAWLDGKAHRSRAALYTGDGSAQVAAEGVVLRGFDREGGRLLAKLRFEDYRRALRPTGRVEVR